MSHFTDALFCNRIDDLKKFRVEPYDGIVFDDMAFNHWPSGCCIQLTDVVHSRSINVRYGIVYILRGTRRIFTFNKLGLAMFFEQAINEERAAIERRCYSLELNHQLF